MTKNQALTLKRGDRIRLIMKDAYNYGRTGLVASIEYYSRNHISVRDYGYKPNVAIFTTLGTWYPESVELIERKSPINTPP